MSRNYRDEFAQAVRDSGSFVGWKWPLTDTQKAQGWENVWSGSNGRAIIYSVSVEIPMGKVELTQDDLERFNHRFEFIGDGVVCASLAIAPLLSKHIKLQLWFGFLNAARI